MTVLGVIREYRFWNRKTSQNDIFVFCFVLEIFDKYLCIVPKVLFCFQNLKILVKKYWSILEFEKILVKKYWSILENLTNTSSYKYW